MSVLTGTQDLPLATRVLTAGAVTAASSAVATILLANALAFWFDGAQVVANVLLAAAILAVAGAGAAWFRLLPAVRWLGVPVALGAGALCWDLLVAFLPA